MNIGSIHLSFGAKKAVISQEDVCQILYSGKPIYVKHSLSLFRQEAENMCKMMAVTNYALTEHEDLGTNIPPYNH